MLRFRERRGSRSLARRGLYLCELQPVVKVRHGIVGQVVHAAGRVAPGGGVVVVIRTEVVRAVVGLAKDGRQRRGRRPTAQVHGVLRGVHGRVSVPGPSVCTKRGAHQDGRREGTSGRERLSQTLAVGRCTARTRLGDVHARASASRRVRGCGCGEGGESTGGVGRRTHRMAQMSYAPTTGV